MNIESAHMNIESAQWVSDELTKSDQYSITIVVDGKTWSVLNKSVGNRFYDEVMRQVEQGTLTIKAAE